MKDITLGLINNNQPEFIYYSILNLKKILKDFHLTFKIINVGTERAIINKLDDVEIINCFNETYFEFTNKLLTNCTTETLITINPTLFVTNNITNILRYTNDYIMEDNNFDFVIYNKLTPIDENSFIKYRSVSLDSFSKKCNTDIIEFLKTNELLWKTIYEDVIVSLTTFKGRIYDNTVYEVIMALLHQKTQYNYKVVLVLAEEEFKNKNEIPQYIKQLLYDYSNFELLWTVKDTRPLKKLDPTLEKYPDLPIITLDDDDYCYINMVENVVNEHRKNPYYAMGTLIEKTFNFVKWIAGVRIWPPHCLYEFPLDDYYTYYDGILDDNFNAMRCAFKLTPVCSMPKVSKKHNQTELKLTTEYENTNWGRYYKRFIINHLDEIPDELYYVI